jgi:hypothetical protein
LPGRKVSIELFMVIYNLFPHVAAQRHGHDLIPW